MKLSLKLWIYFVISTFLSVIVFVASAIILGHYFNDGYTHKDFKRISANMIEDLQSTHTKPSSLDDIFAIYESKHPDMSFNWFSEDGHILYSTSGRQEPYHFSEYSDFFVNQPYALWTPDEEVNLIYAARIEGERYYLHFQISNEMMQSTQIHLYVKEFSDILPTSIPLLTLFIVPFIFTYVFFSSLRKRLRRLNEGLSETTLEHQREIHDPSKDEIGQLARHFNAMSQRIHEQVAQNQEQENKRKKLISNLSHDLRTPLTNILGYAETIEKGLYKNKEELQTHSRVILVRSRYMEKLLDTLFEVSQFDKHGIQLKKETCHLAGLIRKILAEYIPLLELKEIETHFSIPDTDTRIQLDPHYVERSLRNLLENALEYGESGRFLGVEYNESKTQVSFSVVDHGPGILKEHLPLVFDRFFQGSESRNKEGFGIGLSIVKEIADAHNGTISVTSIPGKETRFTLTLPR